MLSCFDRVILVESGKIIACGRHDDLILHNSLYQAFVQSCNSGQGTAEYLTSTSESEIKQIHSDTEIDCKSSENHNKDYNEDRLINEEEDMGNSSISLKIYMLEKFLFFYVN